MDIRNTLRLGALSLFTLVFVAAGFVPAADGHGGAPHPCACPICAGLQPIACMPAPEAYPTPAATPAVEPTVEFGASTVRLRASKYQIYRFGARGKLLQQRTIQLARPKVWRTPANESTFGTGRFVKLASGPFSGWWIPAGSTKPAATTTFTPDLTVNIRAGRLVARRFFGPAVTRRVATLSGATTFSSSQRAVFNNTTHYLLVDGPLAGRWVPASRVIVPSSGGVKAPTPAPTASAPPATPNPSPTADPTTAPAAGPVSTWNAVVLLYRDTDVTFRRQDGTDYRLKARMSDTMYNLVRKTLGQFEKSAATWSGGLVTMNMKIIDMPSPLTRVDPLGSSYWVGPQSVQADMDKYAPKGAYDSVFVVYQPTDDKGVSIPIGGWGLTIPDGWWSNNSGFSSVVTPHEMWWWTGSSAPEEVFVHEWMHQVLFFHERYGRTSLDLHAGDKYGYKDKDGSWKTWLIDVMQGKIKDGNKLIGVSGEVWAAGKPSAP